MLGGDEEVIAMKKDGREIRAVRDPHITGGIRYDWPTIMLEYVTDPDATLRKISEKHGISYGTVASRAKKDQWYKQRKEHQMKVVQQAISKTGAIQARELSREADFLAAMKGHLGRMLSDEQQFNRHLVTTSSVDKDGMVTTTEERLYEKFDSRAMRDAMQVLTMIEDMTRSLYNISKAEAIRRAKLDSERAQLEREKFEFEKEKAAFHKPDKTSITIDGLKEEWTE